MLKRGKAFFRVTIDYDWDTKKEGKQLCLDRSNDNNFTNEIIQNTKNIIQEDLPEELKKAYGLRVRTYVTHVTDGSIVVIFSAAFGFALGVYYFVANYPGFRDGCSLLKKDLNRLLGKMLTKYSSSLQANVELESPEKDKYIDKHHREIIATNSDYFWPMIFSLLLNIALSGLLLLLAWRAIKLVYF